MANVGTDCPIRYGATFAPKTSKLKQPWPHRGTPCPGPREPEKAFSLRFTDVRSLARVYARSAPNVWPGRGHGCRFQTQRVGLSLVACAIPFLPVFTGTANATSGALIRNYQSGECLDADANFLGYHGDRGPGEVSPRSRVYARPRTNFGGLRLGRARGQSAIARRRTSGDQPSRPSRPSQASHESPTCPQPRAVGYLLAISLRC
jgi:hypothetical protein